MRTVGTRYTTTVITVVLAAILMALMAGVGMSAINPIPADAATKGGEVGKCGGGRIYLNAKEKETFIRHNRIRRDHGLKTLCIHPALQRAARAHSTDMIRRDYFSHSTRGRYTFYRRLRLLGYAPNGYSYYRTGENIAYGSGPKGAPRSIMHAWMQSPGHRHNILTREFREAGIGVRTGEYKGYVETSMYTVDFGVRR